MVAFVTDHQPLLWHVVSVDATDPRAAEAIALCGAIPRDHPGFVGVTERWPTVSDGPSHWLHGQMCRTCMEHKP